MRRAGKLGLIVLCAVTPAAGLVIAAPAALSLPPWEAQPTRWVAHMLATPFYAGIIAAPGYLYALHCVVLDREPATTRLRVWCSVSVGLGVAVALLGTVAAALTFFLLAPAPALSLVGSVVLLREVRQFGQRPIIPPPP